MPLSQIDIQQGRIKHFLFKSKVKGMIFGGKADDSLFQNGSDLLTWIKSMSAAGYSEDLKQLESLSRNLNSLVSHLIFLYKNNRIQEAKDGLPGLEKYSEEILKALEELEQKIKGR
jgi:hypothetical protein